MKFSWKHYIILLCILIGSISISIFVPLSDLLQQITAIPGVLALIGALYQLLRDEAKFQKEKLLQRDQQLFDIGATSHMANVTFDKHVMFCEEYIAEMYSAIQTLYRDGPRESALKHSNNLSMIQNKHRLWLTPSIENALEPFENALRKIGANSHLYNQNPAYANDSGKVAEADSLFRDILNIAKKKDEPIDEQIAFSTILKHIRKILEVEELTMIRKKLMLSVSKDYKS